jgi:PKD repeat protein
VVREEIMKRLIILCVLLLCIVPLVSAGGYGYTNMSLQTPNSAPWVRNQTVPVVTADEICAAYGLTPEYPPGSSGHDAPVIFYIEYPYTNMSSYIGGYYQTDGYLGYAPTEQNLTWSMTPTYIAAGQQITCAGNKPYTSAMHPYYNNSLYAPPPIANFTAAPLNATAPAYVAFTDTSTNETGTCAYNWSYTPNTGVLVAPQDLDNEDITMLFTENGDFTISHGVSCAAGSDIETKTDYIHIMNATALSTFRVRAVDAISGYGINGAAIGVFDVENASWTNQTATVGEVTISALTGHTINAYGSATGYDDGESLGLPVVANSLYPIYMWQSNMGTNVSAGNFTLYVTVLEDGTNNRLSGYSLTVFAPNGVYTSGVTNSNGIFQTTIQNKTDYNIEVAKQKGHLGGQKIFNSGTQVGGGDAFIEQTIFLPLETVTPTTAVTTLPGGGTPTATQTVDPYPCDADHPDNCKRKQTEMGNTLVQWGPELLMLFIVATIVGTIKIMGKK